MKHDCRVLTLYIESNEVRFYTAIHYLNANKIDLNISITWITFNVHRRK